MFVNKTEVWITCKGFPLHVYYKKCHSIIQIFNCIRGHLFSQEVNKYLVSEYLHKDRVFDSSTYLKKCIWLKIWKLNICILKKEEDSTLGIGKALQSFYLLWWKSYCHGPYVCTAGSHITC